VCAGLDDQEGCTSDLKADRGVCDYE
jgi:hypothetical protein